jgi:hypothetical protein
MKKPTAKELEELGETFLRLFDALDMDPETESIENAILAAVEIVESAKMLYEAMDRYDHVFGGRYDN